MAAVVDQANNCLGVVTLEDIIEELIQEEIEDEKDFLKKNKHIEKMLGGRRYSIDGNSSPTKHDTVVNLSATSGARTANGVSKAEDKLQSLDSIGDDDVLL
jgi:CBS domain containing-hemolysin-like protein